MKARPGILAVLLCFLLLAGPGRGDESARTVVLSGGRYLDDSGEMKVFTYLVLTGGRISAIVGPGERYRVPDGAEVFDTSGRWVIPGLIDGHVHLVHILRALGVSAEELFPLFLAHGVTTVRDVGDELEAEQQLAAYAAAHPQLAPTVFMGSPLVDGPPAYHPWVSWPVSDPAKVPAFVERLSAAGVRTFKIYVGTSREVGRAVVREGQARGAWVTAHLAWGYTAQEAAEDGINSLEHIGSLYDFILPPGAPRWPPPSERTKLVPERLAALEREVLAAKAHVDVDGPEARALIDSLVKHGVAVNPTLVVYRNWMLLRDLDLVQTHPDLSVVPARLRDGWQHSAQAALLDPATRPLRQEQFERMKQLTLRLQRAGVTLMAGSDTPVQFCPPGAALQQELELLTQAGLTPAETLRAATRNNARALGQTADLGSIEVGKIADLVILSSDPLVDIRHTRDIYRVLHGGRVLDPAELLRQVPVR